MKKLALLIALCFTAQAFAGGVTTQTHTVYTDINVSEPVVHKRCSDGKEVIYPRQQVVVTQQVYEPETRVRVINEHRVNWEGVSDVLGTLANLFLAYEQGRINQRVYQDHYRNARFHCERRGTRFIEPREKRQHSQMIRVCRPPLRSSGCRSGSYGYSNNYGSRYSSGGLGNMLNRQYYGAFQEGNWQRSSRSH